MPNGNLVFSIVLLAVVQGISTIFFFREISRLRKQIRIAHRLLALHNDKYRRIPMNAAVKPVSFDLSHAFGSSGRAR